MNAPWYSGTLRWIASAITRLADHLDTPSNHAAPLAPGHDLPGHEDYVFELRSRLTSYY